MSDPADGAVADMMFPGQCLRCSAVYDLADVDVIHRYADCTLFVAPCCNARVDDRPEGWGGGVRRLTPDEAADLARGVSRHAAMLGMTGPRARVVRRGQ